MVHTVEDMVYDYTFTAAITTLALGNSEQIENVQPKMVKEPKLILYQLRIGVDVGMVFVELMAGSQRRTPFKQKTPTSTSPYVGHFNENISPFIDPKIELFMRYNETPAFKVYNPWGFSITPILAFRGRKLEMYELVEGSAKLLNLSPARITQLRQDVFEGRIPARRITALGIEEG